jgi:hypothetical protein
LRKDEKSLEDVFLELTGDSEASAESVAENEDVTTESDDKEETTDNESDQEVTENDSNI